MIDTDVSLKNGVWWGMVGYGGVNLEGVAKSRRKHRSLGCEDNTRLGQEKAFFSLNILMSP
jgi:hypothetical protein